MVIQIYAIARPTASLTQAIELIPMLNRGKEMGKYFASAAVVALAACHASSSAQNLTMNPPDVKVTDPHGVNLISGLPQFSIRPLSIGSNGNNLFLEVVFDGFAKDFHRFSNFGGGVFYSQTYGGGSGYYYTGDQITAKFLGFADVFKQGAAGWESLRSNGATMAQSPSGNFIYTTRNGVAVEFDPALSNAGGWGSSALSQAPVRALFPSGEEYTAKYSGGRILSITRNDGLQFRYTYSPDSLSVTVTAVNLAVDYCDAMASTCAYSRTWPTATFTYSQTSGDFSQGTFNYTVVDTAGTVTLYNNATDALTSRVVALKSSSSPSGWTATYQYQSLVLCYQDPSPWKCDETRKLLTTTSSRGSDTWQYTYTQPVSNPPPQTGLSSLWESSSTSSSGFSIQAQHFFRDNITQWISASNGRLYYSKDVTNRVVRAVDSEGRTFDFEYDSRGNITKKTQVHALDSSKNLVITASFDPTCANAAKCNKPNWMVDANGNKTDYVYDPVHGGVLSETQPADINGIRPQKRFTYVQRYAWTKNSAGSYSRAITPIWKLNTISYCRTSAYNGTSCQVPGDEVVTTFEYGPDAGPSNLFNRGRILTSADSAQTTNLRTCYKYDVLGNRLSETSPGAALTNCP